MSGRGNYKALRHQLKLLIIQMKPHDTEAEAITFGIELETTTPEAAGRMCRRLDGQFPDTAL